jgi:tetratricopeptide (TPR) repeat protein
MEEYYEKGIKEIKKGENKKGLEQFEKSNNNKRYLQIAMIYFYQNGVAYDEEVFLKNIEKAIETEKEGYGILGEYNIYKKNIEKAMELFEEGIKNNDRYSYLYLSRYLMDEKHDVEKSLKLLEDAVEKYKCDACSYSLGYYYHYGWNMKYNIPLVDINPEKAKYYYELAIEYGFISTYAYLGKKKNKKKRKLLRKWM